MNTKKVYQLDRSGMYVGDTLADESPMEPGVYLLPARCIEQAPPTEWPNDKWPRWNGSTWELASKPLPAAPDDSGAAEKLTAFLRANPDVAALVAGAPAA